MSEERAKKEWESNEPQSQEELQAAVQYYKRLSDEVAGYNIRADSKISLLKRALNQKQDGFSILSALHDVFESRIETKKLLDSTLERINTTLKMDRSLVLWEAQDQAGWFAPSSHLGYAASERKQLAKSSLDLSDLVESGQSFILANRKAKLEESAKQIRDHLFFRFFLGVPIRSENRTIGWLLSGRDKEAWPFYPPLDKGDLDTFKAIAGFIEAGISNARLYQSLEKANAALEASNRQLEARVKARTIDLEKRNQELAREKKRTDELLLNILPAETAEELKVHGSAKAKHFDEVTVMFADFVNFTQFAELLSPSELVAELDTYFRGFDRIIMKYGLEKIKTIGDAYLCTGGLPVPGVKPADVLRAAFDIRDLVAGYAEEAPHELKDYLSIRIGIHTGPLVAGVVGLKKFSYDIWGDTVNTAARMESGSLPGKINVSGAIYSHCKDQFAFEYRGQIEAKNKGAIDMYFVEKMEGIPKEPG